MAILTLEELARAIRQLPRDQKITLWKMLDAELVGRDVDREFDQALKAIWAANQGVTEDEAMADALTAVRDFRAEESKRRS